MYLLLPLSDVMFVVFVNPEKIVYNYVTREEIEIVEQKKEMNKLRLRI